MELVESEMLFELFDEPAELSEKLPKLSELAKREQPVITTTALKSTP